jgi:hypothetical protein
LDDRFLFNVPDNYPISFDKRDSAPLPPPGRKIVIKPKKKKKEDDPIVPTQKLPTVQISVDWLKQAVHFAHHNMKTKPPDNK